MARFTIKNGVILMQEYKYMDRNALLSEQARLKELLDEVKEEKDMMLGQSGQHIPTTKYVKKYKKELDEIEEKISAVKSYLAQ